MLPSLCPDINQSEFGAKYTADAPLLCLFGFATMLKSFDASITSKRCPFPPEAKSKPIFENAKAHTHSVSSERLEQWEVFFSLIDLHSSVFASRSKEQCSSIGTMLTHRQNLFDLLVAMTCYRNFE
jgi:hypothetical protein